MHFPTPFEGLKQTFRHLFLYVSGRSERDQGEKEKRKSYPFVEVNRKIRWSSIYKSIKVILIQF